MFNPKNIKTAITIYNQSTDCIVWKDLNSNYKMMNNQYAKLVGFKSSQASFEELTDFDIPCKAADIAEKFIEADRRVIHLGKTLTSIEFCCYTKEEWRIHYDRKSPLRDAAGKIIGIACYAIDVTECPIMRSALALLSITSKKLNPKNIEQNSFRIQKKFDTLGLTSRQSQVLFYMIRGKSSKEIARLLDIEYKTVENHQYKLKSKMDCSTKSQLIEKAFSQGVGFILPQSLLTQPHQK